MQSALLGRLEILTDETLPDAPPDEIARRQAAVELLLDQLAEPPAETRLHGRRLEGDTWELQDAALWATTTYFAHLSDTADDLTAPRGGLLLTAELRGALGVAGQFIRLVESVGVPSRPGMRG